MVTMVSPRLHAPLTFATRGSRDAWSVSVGLAPTSDCDERVSQAGAGPRPGRVVASLRMMFRAWSPNAERTGSPDQPVDGVGWITLAHIGAIVAAAMTVYLPSFGNPLRLWDHHVIMLLAKAPQFGGDLFWRLVHYRIGFDGFSDDTMYFRVLSMPVTWGLARLFQDASALYYATHLLVHVGVAVVLYVLAIELCGDRTLAALAALLFTVYGGQGDTVNLPVYTFMLLSLLLAEVGLLGFLRYLRTGRVWLPAGSAALLTLATLLYDAFLLLTVALPLAAAAVSIRRRGPSIRAAGGPLAVLAGVVLVLALVLASVRLSPATQSNTRPGAMQAVSSTLDVLVRDGRVLRAVGFGAEALAMDAQVFLTGHLPGIWHRGNLPYWDLGALRRLQWRLDLALGLMLAGLAVLARAVTGAHARRAAEKTSMRDSARRSDERAEPTNPRSATRGEDARAEPKILRHAGGAWPVVGVALLAAGTWADWRTGLLAVPLAMALGAGWRSVLDIRVVLVVASGLLVSFNIALGRANGYNVVAFRHHYVTGVFVVLALMAVLGAGEVGRSGLRRRLSILALSAGVALNAAVTVQVLDGVRRDNAMVFSFDRALAKIREQHGPRALFVAFSPSRIRGSDWQGFPLQDIAFDILHFRRNPMTRYTNRASLVVWKDGQARPNPLLGRPDGGEFRFQFSLTGLPPGPHEIFGVSAREPRIILSPHGVALQVRRRGDGTPVGWNFPVSATTLPAVVTLTRAGDTLVVTEGATMIGRATMPPPAAYHPWESDNAALLGRGFERVAAGSLIFDSYIRIGPAPDAESRPPE